MLNYYVQAPNMKKKFSGIHCRQGEFDPFLRKRASKQMDLITVHYDNITNVSLVPECKQLLTDDADVFNSELGSLPGGVYMLMKLHIAAVGLMPLFMISQVRKRNTNTTNHS